MPAAVALSMNYAKIGRFDHCVEARPAPWQCRHVDHKNRFEKRILWAEVAGAVLPDVSDAGHPVMGTHWGNVPRQHCWEKHHTVTLTASCRSRVESNQGALPAASPSTDSQAIVSDLSDQEIAASEAAYEEPSPAPRRRQRKRKREDEDLQRQLDEVSSLLEKHKPPDEHEHFAMSLASRMSAVKPENVLEMLVKLLQVIQMFKEK
ncbi:hypothetical protein HPB50_004574 [Hyalomma asiaticum]|uniref:Uncharacterized protein n=1 Tax=Hyalomma asiaticum TaxID=266040 RepID=A0ACB7SME4_HYAAI|nr:hypothetical protein HPB50_004574 [Hyalomma asiaticum]